MCLNVPCVKNCHTVSLVLHTRRTEKVTVKQKQKLKSMKAVAAKSDGQWWVGEDLWWKGFVVKVCFEFGVKESGSA